MMKMAYTKTEIFNEPLIEELKGNYKNVIDLLGEDASREGLLKPPNALQKLCFSIRRVTGRTRWP